MIGHARRGGCPAVGFYSHNSTYICFPRTAQYLQSECTVELVSTWFSTYSWIVSTPHSVPVYTSCTSTNPDSKYLV